MRRADITEKIVFNIDHHNNNKTAMALKSSEARAQNGNKTSNHIQEPGTYRGHHQFYGAADYLRWKSNF